jgi:hypothetical protein
LLVEDATDATARALRDEARAEVRRLEREIAASQHGAPELPPADAIRGALGKLLAPMEGPEANARLRQIMTPLTVRTWAGDDQAVHADWDARPGRASDSCQPRKLFDLRLFGGYRKSRRSWS